MTRTRWTVAARFSRTDPHPADALDGQSTKTLLPALVLGALATLLLALGSVLPVVDGAVRGYPSAPLLIVLAVAPLALAGAFLLSGRVAAAAGVFAGVAALVPGRAVLDLQFIADPSAASRPELYRPEVFALPGAGVGLWLLLAGHVATVAAGIVAVRALGPRPDSGSTERGLLPVGLVAAGVAAIGVMMAPFSGNDAFLPVGSAFERPTLVLTGCLLLAFALPAAAGLAISSGSAALSMGGLLGLGLAAATVALPELVSGAVVTGLGVSAGPVVVLVGALGLVVVAFLPSEGQPVAVSDDEAGEAKLPGSPRLQRVAGVLGVLTMLAAIAGTFTDQVIVTGELGGPQSPSRWLLLVAGLLVGVLGVAMFVPRLAPVLRPVLSVAWVGVPLAATAVLTTAITASELGAGLSPGPGVLWTSVAAATAVAVAVVSVIAGMVERDDSDESLDVLLGPNMITPLVAGGILAVGGFGTPSIVAPDYVEPALWSNFGTPSWGLLLALLTVLGACFLAPRSRPARATALLAGATCVAALRVLALPLTGDQIPGAHAGVGWWIALGCVVALAIATVLAPRGTTHTRKTPSGSIR
ncbi:hypothetical protein FHX82_000962 [Amycolatopsis bartoniae]|uniref:Uncharacterized protein n=1 Tax=Amycolatopsis bartoniae TaxID=941986 RepID=A0A8H9J5D2_9PSEU|nr:hypothetical protein [Amycolatopsis bartoniae]MBB2933942.1 hypothetical protein [Amycolatopsis bartoniae]TVS98779.1 hypothetical protein FNH07_36680 [Amycolatopsis bartoniae]GHF87973.1 hypothetical protein GCM10017566_72150 [Amycolatopsis bartoniae]